MVNLDPKIVEFLVKSKLSDYYVSPLAGDASDRQYYRLILGSHSLILMDSSKTIESLNSFLTVGEYLSKQQFSVPEVFQADIGNGYLILEDLSDFTLNTYFLKTPNSLSDIYHCTVDLVTSLITLQDPPLPEFDTKFFLYELSAFTTWYMLYIGKVLSDQSLTDFIASWDKPLEYLSTNDKNNVFVHKDLHCGNLFWLPKRSGVRKLGIIDFQSAKSGSIVYDITSLLYDCRFPLPQSLQSNLSNQYLTAIGFNAKIFKDLCDIYIAQRNIKILGNFTYVSQHKGNPLYLEYLPSVWKLVTQSLNNPILKDVKAWFLKNNINPEINFTNQ